MRKTLRLITHTSIEDDEYGERYLIGNLQLKRRDLEEMVFGLGFCGRITGQYRKPHSVTQRPFPLVKCGEEACSFLLLSHDSSETFFHSTFLGVWVKSSGTCHSDIVPVCLCWVAVFIMISEVEFSTTLYQLLFKGIWKLISKKTTLALLGEK